jgi:hypothetical protein
MMLRFERNMLPKENHLWETFLLAIRSGFLSQLKSLGILDLKI